MANVIWLHLTNKIWKSKFLLHPSLPNHASRPRNSVYVLRFRIPLLKNLHVFWHLIHLEKELQFESSHFQYRNRTEVLLPLLIPVSRFWA